MIKLLKNEWKRYRISLLVLLICAVGIAVLLTVSISAANLIDNEANAENITMAVSSIGSTAMLTMLLMLVPFSAYIYPILSYATDVSKKGMMFLTPTPVWKIILSKLLFGAGIYIAMTLVTGISVFLISLLPVDNNDFVGAYQEMLLLFQDFQSDDGIPEQLMLWLSGFVSLLHVALMIMASISMGRFVAMSTAAQVILTIVFYYLISMIEWLIQMLTALIISGGELWEWVVNLATVNITELIFQVIYAAVLYIICVCLTDRKVNLA